MGHIAEYGLALWAAAQNFVKRYGPRLRITANSLKSFKGTVRQKVYIYIMHYPRPMPSMVEILPSLKKNLFCAVGYYAD
jgi:hypothetical protein